MDAPPGMVIRVARPDADEGHHLIQQLDDDLRQRSPGATIHGLRPQDIADRQLTCLIARIDGHTAGCGALRPLETGIRQPEAIGLYRSAGNVEIPCFGQSTGDRFSVCFEKRLA